VTTHGRVLFTLLRWTWVGGIALVSSWAVWMFFFTHPEVQSPFGLADSATQVLFGVAVLVIVLALSIGGASLLLAQVFGQMAWILLPVVAMICCYALLFLPTTSSGS
jgi:hypothetical protein